MSKVLLVFLILLSCQTEAQEQKDLRSIIQKNGIAKSSLKIYIDKSDYELSVMHSDTILITYPCVLGFNPVDDKRQEGDGCTPEGTFKIVSKYSHKSWSYFIWIDYPNKQSWKKFNVRKQNGEIDEGATIGGEIGIHGVPEGADDLVEDGTNWTLGCISLKTAHIKDLYFSISDKTVIEIVP